MSISGGRGCLEPTSATQKIDEQGSSTSVIEQKNEAVPFTSGHYSLDVGAIRSQEPTVGESNVSLGELGTLFQVGTVGDVDDNQLLERFLSGQDRAAEAAFAALVERHGPMVMRLCRRCLGDPHDAQDAFQATFLILVKRARSIRNQRSVASWLFGVAGRVAARAKRDGARRRANERHSAEMTGRLSLDAPPPETWTELYEEIDRLPEKYRLPIVLHYLEHLTYEQVAKQIKCPLRTVQTRLARGRERLRTRLTRRGLGTSAGLLVATRAKDTFPAGFSNALVVKVARDASRFASGSASSLVSAQVASWTSGVLRIMIMTKLVSASVLALAIGGIGVGVAVLAQQGPGDKPAGERRPSATSPEPPRDAPDAAEVTSIESKDQAIHEKLDMPIEVNFDNKPLQDLLKLVKAASTGPTDYGIPIYVEPIGLQEAEQSMTSPVEVATAKGKGIKARQVLDQALGPLGLSFTVKDGLLIVSSRSLIAQRRLESLEDRLNTIEFKLDRILKAVERGEKTPGR